MIPRECKQLEEVALPIAAVSELQDRPDCSGLRVVTDCGPQSTASVQAIQHHFIRSSELTGSDMQ